MTPRKDKAGHAPYASRHDRELRSEAEDALDRSSSLCVELRLVDPGDGDVRVVLAVQTAHGLRYESIGLGAATLGEWLRTQMKLHCVIPRRIGP